MIPGLATTLGALAVLLVAGCSASSSGSAQAARGPETPAAATPAPGPRVQVIAPQPAPAEPPAPAPATPPTPPAPAAPITAPPAPPPPPAPRRFVVFNFDNADVELVVQAASEIVGFNYVIAPTARGRKVTVQTTGRIASDEVFSVLLTILDVNGLAAVKSGNLYRIIPKEGAPQASVKMVVGRILDAGVASDEVLTQIVPLQYVSATEAVTLLRPFVPPQGAIVGHRESNLLIITDTGANIRRVLEIVKQVDADTFGGQRVFIYFAENTKAKDLAATLEAIYGRPDRGAPRPTSVTEPPRPPGMPAPPPPPAAPPAPRAPSPPRPGIPGIPAEEGVPVFTEVRFIADEPTNAIIVMTHPRLWKEIEETIKKLDKMPRQVLIEVLAAEVTLSDDTKLGIEWALRSGRFDVQSSPSGTIPGRPLQNLIPKGGTVLPGLNFFTFATDQFLTALNALARENRVNVLSSPSIMTTENKKAVINVSTSVPIVTGQQVPVATGGTTGNSITQTVEYRDAGIILTVTPRIGEQGTVALDVKQEVNEVGANEPPPINSPRFTKREAETSVVLLNNQTLVLGGLIQNKRTDVRSGIPFLKDIPVLGYLFGSVQEKLEKTELLLLITPRVVGTAVEAARITEEMREITPAIRDTIKRAPRQPGP